MQTIHAEKGLPIVFCAVVHQYSKVCDQAMMSLVIVADKQYVDFIVAVMSTELHGYHNIVFPAEDIDCDVVHLFKFRNLIN